jgi:hypothetical protein
MLSFGASIALGSIKQDARCKIISGYTYAGNSVQDSRSTNDQTDARSTGQISVRCRGIASGLLVPKANEAYADVDGLLSDVRHRYADNAKDDGHTQVPQGTCDDGGACDWRLTLRGHNQICIGKKIT